MSHSSVKRLGPPPRDVPLLLSLQITFGGCVNQFGWFFFGFGMIFFWAFFMNCELLTWFTFWGQKATTQAVVTKCSDTKYTEGGNEDSDGTPIYAIEYWYPSPDGTTQPAVPVVVPSEVDPSTKGHRGRSYATGKTLAPGTQVTVDYLVRNPSASRIQGMRGRIVGAGAGLVVIFPLVGLCTLLPGYFLGRKARRLLERGTLGAATLKSKERTNTEINNQPVCRLTFEFQANDGQMHEVVAKTHITRPLEDEAREKIIYDPLNPNHAVVLDALPGSFVVDEQGMIRTEKAGPALAALIIPFLTIAGHGLYLLLR